MLNWMTPPRMSDDLIGADTCTHMLTSLILLLIAFICDQRLLLTKQFFAI